MHICSTHYNHIVENIPLSTPHLVVFRYTRLPFGVSSSPAIYQRIMDSILQGIPGICVYLADILVRGTTDSEHRQRLDQVL